jgi:hypothetical protein
VLGVTHNQQAPGDGSTNADEAFLENRVARVIDHEFEGIGKDRHGLIERDAVLPQIALRLAAIPRELHIAAR